ncbi:MAG: MetQ/NlpA family ABC transporter substrate-binding protein [Oscillospiraceae bacterium]|nr:MetQ/NlpA family ABC transporter substrate-binding protein [Oscillospiraceae bacterium]
MKRFFALLLAGIMCLALLTACGSSSTGTTTAGGDTKTEESTDGINPDIDYAALDGTTITVAASPTPHAEILKVAGDILATKGITLKVVEYTDYVQPCNVTESGEVDANYFAHLPYLENFNEENGTHLVSAGAIHYEPFGLYPGKTATIDALADGAQIAVPNDGTNEGRALQLLASQGLITLKDDAGLTATKLDIVDNPKNLDIVEMEAAQLPRTLSSVDMAVINGNSAIEAGLSVGKDAVATEDANSEAAQTYANVVAVKEGNEENPAILALVAALQSEAVRTYITDTYDGAVVPSF